MNTMNTIRISDHKIQNNTFSLNEAYYIILLVEGKMNFSIDLVDYEIQGFGCVYLSPYQLFQLKEYSSTQITTLGFHGDFYCIEYHKKEVACNGILFNNIYATPFVILEKNSYQEVLECVRKIELIQDRVASYEVSLMKAYLQLILAIGSKEKQLDLHHSNDRVENDYIKFRELIELHFKTERSIGFYADYFHISADQFSKKIKDTFGKSPSTLLNERMILEAKKLLHLTHKNINIIAHELGFQDEFYFSRYFKKSVGVSPKIFREKVGIAAIAK